MKPDQYLPVFIRTVALIEQLLSLRSESQRPEFKQSGKHSVWRAIGRRGGMIVALYLTACKCRDSAVRFKAIALLERLKLQEGLFSSNLIAPFGRRIAELEGQRARAMNSIARDRPLRCKDVPEAARFLDVTINADLRDPTLGRLVCAVLTVNGSA